MKTTRKQLENRRNARLCGAWRKAACLGFACYGNQCGAQYALGNQVALLQHGYNAVGVEWHAFGGWYYANGLVVVGVELVALRGADGQYLVALKRGEKLAQGGFRAFAHLLGSGAGYGKPCLEAVKNG